MNMNTAAYGAVVLGGLTLFAIGHLKGEAQSSPTTPGLALAAVAPSATSPTPPGGAAVATTAPASTPAPAAVAASAAPVPAAAAPGSVSGGGFTLTSLGVDLPNGDREFPPGPGVEVAQGNCAACHSVGMVMNQPALSRATWETEVHKMIAVYKAPVSEEDAKTIVAYLDSIKGTK